MFKFHGFAPARLVRGTLEVIPLAGLTEKEVVEWLHMSDLLDVIPPIDEAMIPKKPARY